MIRTAPRTDVTRPGLVLALIFVAAMTVGFVAGQVVPDVFGSLVRVPPTVTTDAPALTQNADYGIRHLTAPLATTPLTPDDDYGIRHP